MIRPLAAIALLAILAGACSDSGDQTTSRAPLESPPDPGPIPETDGLSTAQRGLLADSTVRITGVACGRRSEGSGFAVTDHLIATNAHVLVGVDHPVVERGDGSTHEGIVVAFDPERDLALLRVEGGPFTPLPLGTAPDGTTGAVFGWDAGPSLDTAPFRVDRPVTVRIEAVASTERVDRASWLVAAEIESGDSGAALIDSNGVVIGIAYATTVRGSAVGYAVRADELGALIEAGLDDHVIVPDC